MLINQVKNWAIAARSWFRPVLAPVSCTEASSLYPVLGVPLAVNVNGHRCGVCTHGAGNSYFPCILDG